jgi:hypothetical protein
MPLQPQVDFFEEAQPVPNKVTASKAKIVNFTIFFIFKYTNKRNWYYKSFLFNG